MFIFSPVSKRPLRNTFDRNPASSDHSLDSVEGKLPDGADETNEVIGREELTDPMHELHIVLEEVTVNVNDVAVGFGVFFAREH